jgi:hypothetical protein
MHAHTMSHTYAHPHCTGLSYSGAVLGSRDGSYPTDPGALQRLDVALGRAGIRPWELSYVDNRWGGARGACALCIACICLWKVFVRVSLCVYVCVCVRKHVCVRACMAACVLSFFVGGCVYVRKYICVSVACSPYQARPFQH